MNVDGGSSGGDEVALEGGDKLRCVVVFGIDISVVVVRGVDGTSPDEVRGKALRAAPGGCSVNDRSFVGEAIRLILGDAMGFGEARELVLGLGLAGLAAREDDDAADRIDVVRPRPTLFVLAWPAGLTTVGGGRCKPAHVLNLG